MIQPAFNKKRSRKGFTLIELLVVIAIIGILASIVLASLNSARQKSRDARRIADIKQMQLALALYYDAATEYPDALADLAPTYMPSVPLDPTTQASYAYANYPDDTRAAGCDTATEDCLWFQIGATLENSGNQALQNDRDLDDVVDSGPDGVSSVAACAVDAAITAVNDPADKCYDLTP